MVITTKVLALALLSAVGLAVPFDDYSINARNADALAEALLEERDLDSFEIEKREPAFDMGESQLAIREAFEEALIEVSY